MTQRRGGEKKKRIQRPRGVKRVLDTKEVVFSGLCRVSSFVVCPDGASLCLHMRPSHAESSRFRFLRLLLPSLEGDRDCEPWSELPLLDDEGAMAAAWAASKRTWPIDEGE